MTTHRQLRPMVIALLAIGCSKSSSPTGGAAGSAGISVPKEISALPTKSSSSGSPGARLFQALTDSPGGDYAGAETVKFVDERALSQFDALNTIFKALGQTHYADAENVGKGPYGTMVSWVEDRGDGQQKQLVPWVVDSSMVVEGGQDVNRVQVWMRMPMGDGQPHVIKVDLKIYEAPVQKTDGSYADYGVWTLNAKFDDSGQGYFSATAAHAADGLSVVMLHEKEGPDRETRGIMQRSDARGSGKVWFPDSSACHDPNCRPQPITVAYVYDAQHVALKKGDSDPLYKDRSSVVDLVHRYGLYDAETFADVVKSHSFGFPIRFTDAQGTARFGYYGAWQGRHQLWSDGQQSIPEGTTVARADRRPNQAAETYKVSGAFKGTLVKRTLVAADIRDIENLVVETQVNQSMSLRWDAAQHQWINCIQPAQPAWPPTCGPGSAPFDMATLVNNPNDTRRNVNINHWDQARNQPMNLVYDPAGGHGPGLYEVIWNTPPTPPTPTGTLWTPVDGDQVWVNINGSIYIGFNGASWVRKAVVSFDPDTRTPTFDPAGDLPYQLDQGREYYINNPGANYVVKYTGTDPSSPSSYDVKIELQSVANPINASAFVPAGTVFKPQWGGTATTYAFVTDPSNPDRFLKLVYKDVDPNDKTPGAAVGAVVQSGQWGLHAFAGSTDTGVQYNWDYPQQGQDFGSQQFLLNAGGGYVLLDNPIRLQPIALAKRSGEPKTLALQFDGNWVNGLPDIYHDLQKNDFVLTADIAEKVVVIPAGTEVVDADDSSKHYLFKPLQMNEYLATISDPGDLDLRPATALDLQSVPSYVDSKMGPMPELPVKYSEGSLVR